MHRQVSSLVLSLLNSPIVSFLVVIIKNSFELQDKEAELGLSRLQELLYDLRVEHGDSADHILGLFVAD